MDEINKLLRQKGYRLTKQRQQVFSALTYQPQSVAKVVSFLESEDASVDKVTVYRTLDCFVNLGVVGKTLFKDKTAKYELLTETKHHHHLVCDKCGSIEDILLNEEPFLNKVCIQTDFQIKSHSLEFFGICAVCRST